VALPLIVFMPFCGVLLYYWIGIMCPQQVVWSPVQLPWGKIIALVTCLGMLITDRRKPEFGSPLVLTLLFLTWTGFTTLFAVHPDVALAALLDFTKIVGMAALTVILINSQHRIHCLIWIIAISVGFWVFFDAVRVLSGGIAQGFGPP